MKKHKLLIAALIVSIFIFSKSVFAGVENEKSPRVMVHLLDYISLDYGGAVQNGKVLNEFEYKEQLEFVDTLLSLQAQVLSTNDVGVGSDLEQLKKDIINKAEPSLIEKKAKDIKWKIIGITGLELAPQVWPDLKKGQIAYSQHCANCHGATGKGDGAVGANSEPRPANFFDPKMSERSPFQAFNAIRLGVPGTSMVPQPDLSERDAWNLAFYVMSLRSQSMENSLQGAVDQKTTFSLHQVATMSDVELAKTIRTGDPQVEIRKARLQSGGGDEASAFLDQARSLLIESKEDYQNRIYDSAQKKALLAYLNGIEPVEPRLRASDPSLLADVETHMMAIRSAIEKRMDFTEVTSRIDKAMQTIDQVDVALKRSTSPAMTFSVSFGVVLREAFEAILLLITLLGVIRSVGSKKAAFFVHLGWILALLAGVVAWVFSGWVMQLSGASRELLEGITSIVALIVVLYMGFWLHRKTEIGRWRAFLKEMVHAALDGKSLFLLCGISFMAVFREAFETVLFLRAVMLESGGAHQAALISGILSAFFLVVILTIALLKFSARIPIRQLFDISSLIMVLLSFILMGKALHAFQEAGVVTVTQFPLALRFDLVGLYPTYETLVPQLVVLVISLAFWLSGKRPGASGLEEQCG